MAVIMDLLCRNMVSRSWLSLAEGSCHRASCCLSTVRSKDRIPWYQTQLEVNEKVTKSRFSPLSKRVSILRDPGVVTVDRLSKEKIFQLLGDNVVYRKDPLLVISKPQGFSVTGNQDEVSLSSLLPELQQHLGIRGDLHIVKAAPKESSGHVLLSTCHVTTKRIEEFYGLCRKKQRPVATYCAVTVGVPSQAEGEIKAALKVEQIEDLRLVVPVTNPSKGSLEKREVKRAETRYKVLDSNQGCALVQLQPMSVYQAQLLVHVTLMFCRILGDHTYSARIGKVLGENVFLPVETALPRTQMLDEGTLHRMHFSQQQMHRMPLHLHLHQLLIPGQSPREQELLTAPPPPYFQRTLQLLGLKMSEQLQSV
ncbi:hypothetical protein GDO86_007183 [Hymenochirus boettgeri]|uniref:Pseudouridine synthase RsuA/RluA-like domain-containing protein n=1 Tax=Hymenochirus boettgeri TaxID=247094 RepID=A0A8T2IY57_9PIPI|nr:hypothetical protein GDO86_007183 [Hymenochirus boettgeri]